MRRRLATSVAAGLLAGGLACAATPPAAFAAPAQAAPSSGSSSPAPSASQAHEQALATAEDARIRLIQHSIGAAERAQLRAAEAAASAADDAAAAAARSAGRPRPARTEVHFTPVPFRLAVNGTYTLVLTPRSTPYGLADLRRLEPQTLVGDGSALVLTEQIAVLDGATLDLNAPGVTLRLASSTSGFVSIVGLHGSIKLRGTTDDPFTLTSWDAAAGHADRTTADGRAYVRELGGPLEIDNAKITGLGFGAGRTGGIAATGSSRASAVAVVPVAPSAGSGVAVLPAGKLPGAADSGPDDDNTALTVSGSAIDSGAWGLFASNASDVTVSDTTITGSSVTGIDLHRNVAQATLTDVTVTHSAGSGITLGKGAGHVSISGTRSNSNGQDGFRLQPVPLTPTTAATTAGSAAATAAPGAPASVRLSGDTATDNGHSGIAVLGGQDVSITGATISGGRLGIVADGPATALTLSANTVSRTRSHGIALLKGVVRSTVTGNVVTGARIYLRDSSATVTGNTVLGAAGHAISLVGHTDRSKVSGNTLSGTGRTAVDVARAIGVVTVGSNAAGGWHSAHRTVLDRARKLLLHPSTLLWVTVLLLVVVSVFKGLRRGPVARGTNPYLHQTAHLLHG